MLDNENIFVYTNPQNVREVIKWIIGLVDCRTFDCWIGDLGAGRGFMDCYNEAEDIRDIQGIAAYTQVW